MKRKPFILLGLVLGGAHFLASLLIVPITLHAGELLMTGLEKSILLKVLHSLTRILYFPVIGLALYPRNWFPGPWISLPIMFNSLLWGIALAIIVIGLCRIRDDI